MAATVKIGTYAGHQPGPPPLKKSQFFAATEVAESMNKFLNEYDVHNAIMMRLKCIPADDDPNGRY